MRAFSLESVGALGQRRLWRRVAGGGPCSLSFLARPLADAGNEGRSIRMIWRC